MDGLHSPSSYWLASVFSVLVGFLAYLSYTPRVEGGTPPYTTDKIPFVGSWSFFTRRWYVGHVLPSGMKAC
jgi:hypothetical protein